MASTFTESELIRKNKVCESLARIFGYKGKNLNDFLHFFLNEIVSQTCSHRGYVFTIFKKKQSFELTEMIVDSDNKRYVNKLDRLNKISEAGPWIQAFEQNKLFVHNRDSRLFPALENHGLYEVADRLCSLPVTLGDCHSVVLVIADKDCDYDEADVEFLNSLTGPASNFADNFRKLEEVTIAKENAEKNEQRKLSYLVNIAHQIKTPVNAIAGFSQLLKESDQVTGNSQKFLDVIVESSTDLVEIINNVSEISNVESGLINIIEKEVLLSDIFNELFENFKEEVSKKRLLFKTEVAISEDEEKILADSGRLLQVLSALLSNAFKFTFTGKIVFGCKRSDDFIEFFVSDTGIGIPKDEMDKIFDHFFQADNSISRAFKGTGLGLTITKAVVEQLGGKIWCNSVEGKGSDFYFTIPYKRSETYSDSQVPSIQDAGRNMNIKKVILVAEDDNLNFLLIQNFLAALDIVLLRAVNGQEAVNICSLNKVDLVLMDVKMPVMDGFTATRIIKESNPNQIIIAQTAYINDREIALANGCNDFIAKPFGKNQLNNIISRYI
jgi:signal transduction histidine kinase